jgi:hypothetical protein
MQYAIKVLNGEVWCISCLESYKSKLSNGWWVVIEVIISCIFNVFHMRVAHPSELPTKTPKSDYYYYYYTTTLHNDP